MISYKELGLVNTRELFKKAVEGGYAIPAYNFNNMEQLQAIIQACVETKSPGHPPGLLAAPASTPTRPCSATWPRARSSTPRSSGYAIPIVLHLDHGDTLRALQGLHRVAASRPS